MLPRAGMDVEHAQERVRPIIDDVAARGVPAVLEWGERLDGVRAPRLRVPVDVLDDAADRLDPQVRSALEEAIRRVRLVHSDQRRPDTQTTVVPGGTVLHRWLPVDRVGLSFKTSEGLAPDHVQARATVLWRAPAG